MTNLFIQATSGAIASSADYDANFLLVQESFADLGPWIVSGLTLSAGAGLAVTVAAGTASIGGRITASGSFSIAGLANNTTNHLYIKDDGTGTSNTTAVQPADTAKLGTATTSGGVVTATSILRSSGRQALVRHESQVPGNVGSPGSLNLASWNATAGDTFSFYGTLPSGAVPSSLSGDVTLTPATSSRNVIVPTGDAVVPLVTKRHSATQSAHLFEVQTQTGALLDFFDQNGGLIIAPATAAFTLFSVADPVTGFGSVNVFKSGVGAVTLLSSQNNADVPLQVYGNNGGGQTADVFQCWPLPAASGPSLAVDNTATLYFSGDTTVTSRRQAQFKGSFTDTTDATFKGRIIASVTDSGATREAWRAEADGSAPRIGFLGATAIVRPASTTDLRTALINLGLYTTGGASPLNLNGGTLTANRVTTPFVDLRATGEIDLSGSAGTAGFVLTSGGAGAACTWTAATAGTLAALGDVSFSSVAQGDVIYRGAATWNNLAAGTTGQVLITQGAAANPAWSSSPSLGAVTFSGDITLSTHNLITDTSTGTKIGTGTTQKLGFFNATPVAQISGSTDILASLVTLGFRAASSNPPLDMGTGALTAGATTLGGDLTLSTHNLITDTSTGTKIGTATTQKLGFYNATPVAQISGSTDVLAGLVTLGFRAASSNPPLNLGTGAVTAGAISGTSITVPDGTDSERFGASATAVGTQNVVVGKSSTSAGNNNVVVGKGNSSSGGQAVVIGQGASSGANNTVVIGASAFTNSASSIIIGKSVSGTAANQLVIGSDNTPVTDGYFNDVTSTTPDAITLQGAGGSGTDITGANITLAGGKGTGNAAGGDMIFKSTRSGQGSATTLRSLEELLRLSQAGVLTFTQHTSTSDRSALDVTPTWATSTDASRKARAVFNIWDTAVREAMRFEASGSAAMIGFLGATAVARTSAYTVANPTTDRALDVTGDTLAQVAQVLGTLIADLQAFGLLG